ncbi:MAG: NUDIX hydrolase [Clostridia bacterium]|nr:NUDIX hydrolase [Clostridia bacterium]
MNLTETTTSTKNCFEGKILRVRVDTVRLPNGATATRDIVEHNGAVCVAALTESQELLFVRQYRHPFGKVLLELPAGKLDSKSENPLSAAVRELREETGATAADMRFLGELYPSPGYCDEIISLYLATGLSFGESDPDDDEFLEVERIPLKTAVQMVLENEIPDGKTQALVLKVAALMG